jgi:TatD DNase family protein
VVDAHSHLTDLGWGWKKSQNLSVPQRLVDYLTTGAGARTEFFVQGGVDPEEWDRQQVLEKHFPKRVGLVFGYHPWWVAGLLDHGLSALEIHSSEKDFLSDEFRKRALVDLQFQLIRTVALGEIGLDFGKKQNPSSFPIQTEWFVDQLELARSENKPVVLHVVHAHKEALQILKKQPTQGLVHGFAQDWSIAKRYLDLGLVISVGARALDLRSKGLQRTLRQIPLDRLVFETDATLGEIDAKLSEPAAVAGDWSLAKLAEHVALLRGIRAEDLMAQQSRVLRSIFKIP